MVRLSSYHEYLVERAISAIDTELSLMVFEAKSDIPWFVDDDFWGTLVSMVEKYEDIPGDEHKWDRKVAQAIRRNLNMFGQVKGEDIKKYVKRYEDTVNNTIKSTKGLTDEFKSELQRFYDMEYRLEGSKANFAHMWARS